MDDRPIVSMLCWDVNLREGCADIVVKPCVTGIAPYQNIQVWSAYPLRLFSG